MKKVKRIIVLFIIIVFLVSCDGKNNPLSDSQYVRKQCKIIVECFDIRDVKTLEQMFSSSIREKCNLEKEIQAAFDLYEGKSKNWSFISGGTSGGMDDGEWIEKDILPDINIETDSGKKYKIAFYELLIYKKDETMVGIQGMGLYDANGNKLCSIGD